MSDAESDEHSDLDEGWNSCFEFSDSYFETENGDRSTSVEHSDSDEEFNSYFEFSDSYFETEDGDRSVESSD